MQDGCYAMVQEHEMKFLMNMTGPTGLVKSSCAVLEEDDALVITSGPLKDLTGKIVYVDKRKRKAKIELSLLNKTIGVILGLEILEKR